MELKPSRIKRLRKLMKVWDAMTEELRADAKVGDEDEEAKPKDGEMNEDLWLDTCLQCAGIALVPEVTRLSNDPKATRVHLEEIEDENGDLTDEYMEWIEDTLDLDSMYKVLEVCAKLKLNDPKLMEAAQAAMTTDQGGQTSTL